MTSPPPSSPPAAVGESRLHGGFRVDPEEAARAVTELEDAVRELRDIRQSAVELGVVASPTRDVVSADAAHVLGLAASGRNGSLIQALDQGVLQMQTTIDELRSSLAAYRRADDDGATAFS